MNRKIKQTLLILAGVSLISINGINTVRATELTVPEGTYYIGENTYLYTEKGSKAIGEIKEGSNITIQEDSGEWVKITYDGQEGYVTKEVLTDTAPYTTVTDTDGNEKGVQYLTRPEILYPVSHYFETWSDEAAIALLKYSISSETDDDYVLLSDSSNIKVPKGIITNANKNGCNILTLIYTENKQTPSVYVQLYTKDIGQEGTIDVSFDYKAHVFQLKNDVKEIEIKIGYPVSDMSNINMEDSTEDDIWTKVSTTSPVKIKAPSVELSTESIDYNQPKEEKQKEVTIPLLIAALTFAITLGAIYIRFNSQIKKILKRFKKK